MIEPHEASWQQLSPTLAYGLAEPGGGWRIGRVVTAASHRGQGLAAILVGHALGRPGPFVLDAQAHLGDWYGTFGFRRSGADFLLDGIPHMPMRRP